MTLRAYYRRALLLPIVVPLLFAPGLFFVDGMVLGHAVLLASVVASPIVIAIPYLAFVLLVRRRMRDQPDRRLRRMALEAPLLFAPLLGIVALPVAWVQRGSFWSALEMVAGFVVPFAAVLGYVYVAIAEAGRVVLERRGTIEREA
ncbi:MAG TPA: hypothetical protein VFR81_06040 [Longimicrobium sp.]|nr:hypothetical protein [Longimicrobium sp.]